jgi:hypothetical protein
VRDWLHVEDHAEALVTVLDQGPARRDLQCRRRQRAHQHRRRAAICDLLDEMLPQSPNRPHEKLIEFVTDRPGHDARYAIDASKIRRELGWQPRHTFEAGLGDTVRWFLDNRALVGARDERRLSRRTAGTDDLAARNRFGTADVVLAHSTRGDASMRAFIALALASVLVAACTYRSETVERQTPSGRTVVSESSGIQPIGTVEIHDGSDGLPAR